MSPRQRAEVLDPPVVLPTRPLDASDRPRQLKGWRTVRELRDELRFSTDDACRAWLRRQKIVGVRRGRKILVDGLDVDRALRS